MTKAGQGEIDIVPVMGGFRSKVDTEVETAGKTSSNRFSAAFGNGVKGLGAFVGKSLAVAGGLAAGIAAIAVKGGISRQLQIEDATAKMTGLGNSTETVKTAMDSAMSSVKGTAFGMGEAATVASTALASGIKPGEQMTKYLTLVADAATIAGTGMGEMGTIMGKVTNTGKVTNDVLNQFGDRGVGVLQMLAKEYGVTAEEMTSMVSKGKVDAATFEKVLTENLGGAAQKSGDTTKGAFANMGAALSRIGVSLSSGFFPLFKSVFNQVTTTLDGINDKIKPAAEAFGKWFQGKAGPAIANFSTVALAAFDLLYARITLFVVGFQQGMSNVEASGAMGRMQRFGAFVGNVFKEARGGIWAFQNSWKYFDGDITSSGFAGFMERLAFVTKTAFVEMRGGIWAFQNSWKYFDGDITSSGFAGFMERLAFVTKTAFIEMRGGIWAFRAAWAANDGDITSSGFPGFMERVANAIRPIVDAVRALNFSSFNAFTASLGSAGGSAGKSLTSIGESIKALVPAFKEFGEQLPNIGGALVKLGGVSLNLLTIGLGFLAKHVDTIIFLMPAIVAGYVAWRVASSALAGAQFGLQAGQMLMTPVITANNILRIIAVNLEHQHALATGQTTIALNMNLLTMARQKVAQIGSNIATLAGVVAHRAQAIAMGLTSASTIRATTAMIAKGIADKAVAIGTRAAAAAQWVFNAAMSANPIGLVIIAIVALIAGIVLLVKNWDTVVAFLKGAWSGFIDWFTGIMDGLFGWWNGIWASFFSNTVGMLTDFSRNSAGMFSDFFTNTIGMFVDFFTNTVGMISDFFGKMAVPFTAGFEVLKVIFSQGWEIIQTYVATVLAVLIALVTGQWDKIPAYFVSAFQKISGFFTAGLAQIDAILGGAITAMVVGAILMWESLVAWVQSIPQKFMDGLAALANLGITFGLWMLSVKDAAVAKFTELVVWVMGVPGMFMDALAALGLLGIQVGLWILSVKDAAVSKFTELVVWVIGVPGMILNGLAALGNLGITVGLWILSVKDAAVAKFGELVTWVAGVPASILGALGSLDTLLWSAGDTILQGFLNGLTSGFEKVKGFVGGIGTWIAEHKGPEAYDRALLVPAGGWIMGGLNKSLKAGIPDLKGTLGDVSATIRAGVKVPTIGSATAGATAAGIQTSGSGGRPIEMTIIGADGMSAEAMGRTAADSLNGEIRRSGG